MLVSPRGYRIHTHGWYILIFQWKDSFLPVPINCFWKICFAHNLHTHTHTVSNFHRITELQGFKGTSRDHPKSYTANPTVLVFFLVLWTSNGIYLLNAFFFIKYHVKTVSTLTSDKKKEVNSPVNVTSIALHYPSASEHFARTYCN